MRSLAVLSLSVLLLLTGAAGNPKSPQHTAPIDFVAKTNRALATRPGSHTPWTSERSRWQKYVKASTFNQTTSPLFEQTPGYGSGGFYSDSMVTGDFNGDGKSDIAVLNQCVQLVNHSCSGNGTVGVLLGNGDGTYQNAVTSDAGVANPQAFSAGDFNGDGKLDLIEISYGGQVFVLLGKGDGTFSVGQNLTVGAYGTSVTVGDFNQDGKLDAVVGTTANMAGSITMLLGNGDGTFSLGPSYQIGNEYSFPGPAVVGDFNHDGKLDVAMTTQTSDEPYSPGPEINVFLGNGDGTLQPVMQYDSGGCDALAIAAGDFNADGNVDLVVANLGKGNCSQVNYLIDGPIGVLLGNGDGTFQPVQTYSLGGISLAVGDVNDDGKQDIAVGTGYCVAEAGVCPVGPFGTNLVSFLLGNGDGTFQVSPVSYTTAGFEGGSPGTSAVVVQDLNGDGSLDVAVANLSQDAFSGSHGSVGVLLNRADGTFKAVPSYNAIPNVGEWSIPVWVCRFQWRRQARSADWRKP